MSSARWLKVHAAANAIFHEQPGITKERLAEEVARLFGLTAGRSVFYAEDFAVRFAHSSGTSTSNAIVSLKVIKDWDHVPFIVCTLRPTGVDTLLANSTFIEKVSHSSSKLSLTNVCGTVLGSNILRELDGLENAPENFAALYRRHAERPWDENLARIVSRTGGIIPRGKKYSPSEQEKAQIFESIAKAHELCESRGAESIERELRTRLEARKEEILAAASRENVNVRGALIEGLLTGQQSRHGLADLVFQVPSARLLVDIKTKLHGRKSNPKLYNIDKLLRALSDGQTVLALFIVSIDRERRSVMGRLVNVFDDLILRATRRETRWAGLSSRGATQLTGDISSIFDPGFHEHIDIDATCQIVRGWLEL